jgi:phytoene desaturase
MNKETNGKRVIIVGAGVAGLSAAAYLAKGGCSVTILEKNEVPGGRARKFEAEGFLFDMGPSWYWMPDVFDQFFADFNKKTSDYYQLERLDPSYQVVFGQEDIMKVPAGAEAVGEMFEKYEPGSREKLELFLREAKYKYEVGMNEFVEKPGHSILEFADIRVVLALFRLQMFQSISKHIKKLFRHPQLIQLLEFPVLFLGATPENTPAMYSLMNYADISMGTWYPMGGMHEIVRAMVSLCEELGVDIRLGQEVKKIEVKNGRAKEVLTADGAYPADVVLGGADYHHVEQHLLDASNRMYSPAYWEKRTMAPSSLLFYLGVDGKVDKLLHHNLFFDEDFSRHAVEIYDEPRWPEKPLFYACCPSKTDPSVAPEGKENLFLLIPLAPGLDGDDEATREKYYNMVMDRLERTVGHSVRDKVIYKRSFAHSDFQKDYHAFRGNAYGLANTLRQTAFLKPKMKSKKVKNLYFTGQLTTPGPGVPPSLISGRVAAGEILKTLRNAIRYGK